LPILYVIYDSPKDYPGCAVVRAWYGLHPSAACVVLPTVPLARQFLLDHTDVSTCFERNALADDACIVESWL
jgi:hypothetical protein